MGSNKSYLSIEVKRQNCNYQNRYMKGGNLIDYRTISLIFLISSKIKDKTVELHESG